MTHLRARVRCEKDSLGLNNERAGSRQTRQMPIPQWVEIEQGIKGYLLIHVYLREGPFVHTWHDTVEEAKAEARADFGIGEDDWVEVPTEALKK